MSTLGGSIFTKNVMQFDYCFEEAIQSLLDLCDDVVVMDCQSTDGTLDVLRQMAVVNPKLRVIEGANWEVGHKHERLAILANQAASHLKTPWHFMLQADEVIHESSFGAIRRLIENPGQHQSFGVRRINLFGDFNHHISYTSAHKPCNDTPVRLGHTCLPALGDAESIEARAVTYSHINEITVFHYGLVRRSSALIEKSLDMQTWFHGGYEHADHRIKDMKSEGVFDPFRLVPRSEIVPLVGTHPRYMGAWMAARCEEQKSWMR